MGFEPTADRSDALDPLPVHFCSHGPHQDIPQPRGKGAMKRRLPLTRSNFLFRLDALGHNECVYD
jgi:hypothetical protein